MKKIDILKNVLGLVEYNEMYKFFKEDVLSLEADLYIFTTRRCHLLFYLFLNEVFDKQEHIKKDYISDKAIHIYDLYNIPKNANGTIEGKKCVVVDDILIHGRTLESVVSRLEEKKPDKICVRVFAESKYSSFESNHESIDFDSYKIAEDTDWKQLSNKIVACFLLTSTPYTSYIYSFNKEMNENEFNKLIEVIEKASVSKKQLDLTMNECNNNNSISSVISDKIVAYAFEFENPNTEFTCFRLYYNRITKICILIPLCFLSEYSFSVIDEICNCLFPNKILCDVISYETKYRAIVAYYSLYTFRKINNEYNFINYEVEGNNWDFNGTQIDYSYYNNFGNELLSLIKNDSICIESFLNKHISNNSIETINDYCISNTDDIYVNKLRDALKCSKNEKFDFFKMIRSIHKDEEEQFRDVLYQSIIKKQTGLPFTYLKLMYSDAICISKDELFYNIIRGIDTGLISMYPHQFKDSIVCDFFVTGEQICRLYQDQYTIFLKNMYELYELYYINDMTFERFVSESLKDNSKLLSLVQETLENYEDPALLKNIAYESLQDEELNNIFWKEQIK